VTLMPTLSRRRFLQVLSAAPLLTLGNTSAAQAPIDPWTRTLILVRLVGGNDGFNTVVPYVDPAYVAARAARLVDPKALLPLGDGFGLHPRLRSLHYAWGAKELAIIHGVGHQIRVGDHYRATERLDTAMEDPDATDPGWIAATLGRQPIPRGFVLAARLGAESPGPEIGGPLTIST
jgi:uncharacterized protein (DUF1501 family)